MIDLIVILIFAYLIGSIPSGYLIARFKGVEDIRSTGSGNIGATNVARALGTRYFFVVFFCDFMKSFVCLRILSLLGYSEPFLIIAAIALLIGNAASIFLQFRGGKGVATSFGSYLQLMPQVAFVIFGIWLCVLAFTKTVGIASIVCFVALPLVAWLCGIEASLFIFVLFTSIMGLWLHRDNIKIHLTQLFNRQAV